MNGTIIHPLAGLAPTIFWEHPLPSGRTLIPSDPFSSDRGRRTHGGVDYSCRSVSVLAPATGKLERAGWWMEDAGIVVAIEQQLGPLVVTHELLHLSQVGVKAGGMAVQGQVVGVSGNTGSRETSRGRIPVAWHLHWQVRAAVDSKTAEVMTMIRNLGPGIANHPTLLTALNAWLGSQDLKPLAELVKRVQAHGPIVLGVA